ncbi:putative reverse transcriptase zinc-binding domain-containing protein [Helianthus anomalus]
MIRGVLGNGRNIRFWIDPWVSRIPLKSLFPDLFRLESEKDCKVYHRLELQDTIWMLSWKWRRLPNTDIEEEQLEDCVQLIEGIALGANNDRWVWDSASGEDFSVFQVRTWLGSDRSVQLASAFEWCKWLPIKCNVFMWHMLMDRIPTKKALQRRCIDCGDLRCKFCNEQEDCIDHIVTACMLTCGVWNGVASWVNLPQFYFFSINDILQIYSSSGCSKAKKSALHGVLILTCWWIWKARNDLIFRDIRRNVVEIVSDIKALGFIWFSSRFKKGLLGWKDWQRFCFDVM